MKTVIVLNALRDKINEAIDKALKGRPCSDSDREALFSQVLGLYDEYGYIPEFDLGEAKPE